MKTKPSLCWYCANAVPNAEHGCSWSRKFKPVEGWTAKETKVNVANCPCGSFHVYECPQFVRDCDNLGGSSCQTAEPPKKKPRYSYELTALDIGKKFINAPQAARWLRKQGVETDFRNLSDRMHQRAESSEGREFRAYGYRWQAKKVREQKIRSGRSVRCVTRNKNFDSLVEAAEWLDVPGFTTESKAASLRYLLNKAHGEEFKLFDLKWKEIKNEPQE